MKKFWSDEGGAVAVEYVILVAILALGIIVGAGYFGLGINAWFKAQGDAIGNTEVKDITFTPS